ncbi:MAG: hypothetical protein EP341_00865 [Sphingomonadales bacterium]|nr:MAG: hypothetical protein EP341_00865 [Sphingomonadales bacterium]
MAYRAKELISSKYAANTLTTQYTATNLTAVIQQFTITNVSAAAATLTIHLVPNGGTAGASNTILDARSIAVGETYTCPEVIGHVLNNGGFIATISSAASALVIKASGLEITD